MFFKKLFKKTREKELTDVFIEEIISNMVEIPGGSFLMGSKDGEDEERPVHNFLI